MEKCGEDIIIYGAGSRTAKLLRQSSLQSKNIVMIVDKNPNLIDKRIGSIPISPVCSLSSIPNTPVLIFSFNYQEEIRNQLVTGG